MPDFIRSKAFIMVLACIGALAVCLGIFMLGVNVGERKARHFSGWCENYDRMFMPKRGPRGDIPFAPPPMPGAHGVFGKVLSVSDGSIVVQGKDGVEQNVLVTSSTEIRIGRERGTIQDIKADSEAAVFGAPNEQGQIEARLIRPMDRQ